MYPENARNWPTKSYSVLIIVIKISQKISAAYTIINLKKRKSPNGVELVRSFLEDSGREMSSTFLAVCLKH